MNKNKDNNSDLTLQICGSDSESFGVESVDEELFDLDIPDAEELRRPPEFIQAGGELVINGGMEEFERGVPEGWRTATPQLISRITAPGRVHSGNSSVGLNDCAKLRQFIFFGIEEFEFYRLSFFAQLQGTNADLAAEITFLRGRERIAGGILIIDGQDIPNIPRQFGYYTLISTQAPRGVTGAVIEFSVRANGCQTVIIDDVSFVEL